MNHLIAGNRTFSSERPEIDDIMLPEFTFFNVAILV